MSTTEFFTRVAIRVRVIEAAIRNGELSNQNLRRELTDAQADEDEVDVAAFGYVLTHQQLTRI